jgi:hypothetical protein
MAVALSLVLVFPVAAQTPAKNSATLTMTLPTTRTDGSPLSIGFIQVFDNGDHLISIGGPVTTYTTGVLVPGNHVFTVVVCDMSAIPVCSEQSNASSVTVPLPPLAPPNPATGVSAVLN